jgi:hypothetical protein
MQPNNHCFMRFFRGAIRALSGLLAILVMTPSLASTPTTPADMTARFRAEVEKRLEVPVADIRLYGRLAEAALAHSGTALTGPQYMAVVDRDPNVQALFVLWRSAGGEYVAIGASPVSTGRPGSFDHFETPLGVFAHTLDNLDFRAEGTRNENGIRGYGAKGMRVYDFGWQWVPRGWGDGAVSQMRLQMHATDPDLLEPRLGSAQSKGCVRIPASLNRLIDHYGLLDADYEQGVRQGRNLWMLDPQREPVSEPGRYLIVVESARQERPEWAPAPFLPHRKAAPPVRQPVASRNQHCGASH